MIALIAEFSNVQWEFVRDGAYHVTLINHSLFGGDQLKLTYLTPSMVAQLHTACSNILLNHDKAQLEKKQCKTTPKTEQPEPHSSPQKHSTDGLAYQEIEAQFRSSAR